MNKNIGVGTIFKNKYGNVFEVVEHNSYKDVVIRSRDEYRWETTTQIQHIQKRSIRYPYDRSVYGVGFLGIGDHVASVDGKLTHKYETWHGMFKRSYSELYHKRFPTYIECGVCPEWHNFQNFGVWYDKQYIGDKWHIDKDILINGNKIYSPEACAFVPEDINLLTSISKRKKSTLPAGVSRKKSKNGTISFISALGVYGERRYLGVYSTPDEAHRRYIIEKTKQIKLVASDYRDIIREDIYEALMSWEIEIDD